MCLDGCLDSEMTVVGVVKEMDSIAVFGVYCEMGFFWIPAKLVIVLEILFD